MQSFSTAWFLTALILRGGAEAPVDLEMVIRTGDMINHAIFTTAEINEAVRSLQDLEFIIIDKDKHFLVTEKALVLCDKTFMRLPLYSKVERILEKLQRHKTVAAANEKRNDVFSQDEVLQAYENYVKCYSIKE